MGYSPLMIQFIFVSGHGSTPRPQASSTRMTQESSGGLPHASANALTAALPPAATSSSQVSTQRVPTGFPPGFGVAGKTGTLEGIRNEASVVTCPDGHDRERGDSHA